MIPIINSARFPNKMNPGKIIDTPPMDENLRFGATYKTENTAEFATSVYISEIC